MKTYRSIVSAVVAFAATVLPATAASSQGDSGRVTVNFEEPENYADFKTSRTGSEQEREGLMRELRQKIRQSGERYLPNGYHLTLRFRDINLAGEFEPQQGPQFDDVRIIRGVYPPSFHVEYEVRNADGDIAASGERRMTDLAFQQLVDFRKDEPLFYVSELVNELLRDVTRSLRG